MNREVFLAAAVFGGMHPLLNKIRGRRNRGLVLGSAVCISASFYLGSRREYLRILQGRGMGVYGSTMCAAGFYSLGAVFSASLLSLCSAVPRSLLLPSYSLNPI